MALSRVDADLGGELVGAQVAVVPALDALLQDGQSPGKLRNAYGFDLDARVRIEARDWGALRAWLAT